MYAPKRRTYISSSHVKDKVLAVVSIVKLLILMGAAHK